MNDMKHAHKYKSTWQGWICETCGTPKTGKKLEPYKELVIWPTRKNGSVVFYLDKFGHKKWRHSNTKNAIVGKEITSPGKHFEKYGR